MDFPIIASVFDSIPASIYCSSKVFGTKLWLLLRMQDEVQNVQVGMLPGLL
jgi:hypothetical protein